MSRRARLIAPIVVAVALVATGCSSSGSSKAVPSVTPTSTAAAPTTGTPTTGAGGSTPPKITHVFVINLENENFVQTWGPSSQAKWLNNTLRPQGQLLTQYYAIGHASLDNYIAQISGQSPNPDTQSDCVVYRDFASTGTGAYGQALGQGLRLSEVGEDDRRPAHCRRQDVEGVPGRHRELAERAEDLPSPRDRRRRQDDRPYQERHVRDPPRPVRVLPLDHRLARLREGRRRPRRARRPTCARRQRRRTSPTSHRTCATTATTSRATTARPGGLATADVWLQQWVPKILASPAYKAGGMLVITLDEAEIGTQAEEISACCHTPPSPNTQVPGARPAPVAATSARSILSPFTKPDTTNPTPYNHYALLCSLENVWGLATSASRAHPASPASARTYTTAPIPAEPQNRLKPLQSARPRRPPRHVMA